MKSPIELLIEMIDDHICKHKDYANKFDTGAMVAKNFAVALRDYEESYLKEMIRKNKNNDEEHCI